MEPHDDPEARIRDLERGVSYPEHTVEPHGRTPRPWLVLVLGAVVLMVISVVVAFLVGSVTRQATVDGAPETVAGGGGRFDDAPAGRPMPPPAPSLPGVAAATPGPPGEQVRVVGVGNHEQIACADCIVSVSGVSNTVVVIGHAVRLTVSGKDNVVTVDSADAIDAAGIDNQVTYHVGSPSIQKSGFGNVVAQG